MAKKRADVPLSFVMTVDGKILPSRASKARFSKIDEERAGDELARFKSLLRADAVDEFQLTIVPTIMGGPGIPSLTGLPAGFLPQERRFRLRSLDQQHGVATLHYIRERRTTPQKLKK